MFIPATMMSYSTSTEPAGWDANKTKNAQGIIRIQERLHP
jgi:hypothetical protein